MLTIILFLVKELPPFKTFNNTPKLVVTRFL